MTLNLQNKYPGRFDPVSVDYPQGKFKNRSSPTAQDGSYMERDWLNDWAGFFGALLSKAGVVPNGSVDTAQSSQLYNALASLFLPVMGTAADSNKLGGVLATQYAQSSQLMGVGQTWQNVTSARLANTVYTNTTGKPIMVFAYLGSGTIQTTRMLVNGVVASQFLAAGSVVNQGCVAIVPNGATYEVGAASGGTSVIQWSELR